MWDLSFAVKNSIKNRKSSVASCFDFSWRRLSDSCQTVGVHKAELKAHSNTDNAFWLILEPFMLFPGSAEAFWPAWEHWYYRHLYNNNDNSNDNIGSPGLCPGHPAFTPSQSKPRIRFGSFLLQFSCWLSKTSIQNKQEPIIHIFRGATQTSAVSEEDPHPQ